jgi:restriction endonuclease Mrr
MEEGGSGTIEEINNKASEIAGLSDEQLEVLHDPERGGQTEIEYRLAWTRTYLKKYGVLENSSRGVWALTAKGRELDRVNPRTVRRFVQSRSKEGPAASKGLLITTGNFTKDVMREATRDGAPAIDLIDGDQLLDKLKELGLGVQTQKIEVEQVSIDRDWFANV